MVGAMTLLLVVWDELRCGLRVHSYIIDGIARDDIVVSYLLL